MGGAVPMLFVHFQYVALPQPPLLVAHSFTSVQPLGPTPVPM
jgi:hypothetical protein